MPRLHRNVRWLTGAIAPMAVALCGCVPVYLVTDLETRTNGSIPAEIRQAGSGMYVVVTLHAIGREMVFIPDSDVLSGNLVGDLHPGVADSSPGNVFTVGTRAFFTADDNSDGNYSTTQYALFVTDGPEDSTARLTAPGSVLAAQEFEPFGQYGANGVLFLRRETSTGIEVWRSDGTAGGTQIVQDINPGAAHSQPQGMTLFNGYYYFSAAGSDGQRELWRTNGSGATLVKDLNASGQSQPRDFVVFNGSLYFGADQGATFLRGLFKSDGTSNGTVLVTDRADAQFRPEPAAATATTMFLMAYYQQLWVSDGTANGTTFVMDFQPNSEGEVPQNFRTLGSRVLFDVPTDSGRDLWASDGTAPGTVQIATNVDTGEPTAIVGSYLYYAIGDSLYRTNGTVAGTSLVFTQAGLSPDALSAVNGKLFFRGTDAATGTELWSSDGTGAGTAFLGDINTSTLGSNPQTFVKVGSYTYFTADVMGTGRELYRTDGTEAGTVLVEDIVPGATGSSPAGLVGYNGILYFRADDGTNGVELWRSDGTAAGTYMLKNIRPVSASSTPANLHAGPNYLYFYADDGTSGAELWRSDGTAGGTVMVLDINAGSAASTPTNFATLGSQVCFWATRAAEGREPWCSNGTSGGTSLMLDIRAGTSGSALTDATISAMGAHLYFAANDVTNGAELWRTNGTTAGTTRVTQLNAGSGSSTPQRFAVMGGGVFFLAHDGTRYEMWRTDGTTTTNVTGGLVASPTSSNPSQPVVVGSTMFFGATTPANGYELYKSDGTAAGVQLVKDIRTGTTGSSMNYFTAVGDKVFFSANDGVNGAELWWSDGTDTDIATGEGDARSSSPLQLAACGNRLYFTMNDIEFGAEPFYAEP